MSHPSWEAAAMDAESPTRPRPPIHKETLVEILGYAGGVAAVAGTVATFSGRTTLSETATIALMLAVTAVLVAAGAAIGGRGPDGYQRLRSVLWFVSVESFGQAAGLFWVTIAHVGGRTAGLLSALSIAVVALVLWVRLRRSLQQIAFFIAAISVVVLLIVPNSFSDLTDLTTPLLVVWLSGVVWLVLGSIGIVQPARTARVTGAIVALLGTAYLLNVSFTIGLTLLALTAIGLMAVGEAEGDRAVAGLGIVGVLVSATEAVTRATSSSAGFGIPVLAIVVGLVVLGAAILMIRAGAREGSSPATEAPPIPPPPTNY
jgi:drug/metabolite transporter (DMT)-like permease